MPLAWSMLRLSADWSSIGFGTLLHIALAALVMLHCLREPREPRSTLLWIFVAWSMPFFGPLLYLSFGINRLPAKAWHKQRSDQSFQAARQDREAESQPLAYWRAIQRAMLARPSDPDFERINRIMDKLTPGHPLLGGNGLRILTDGTEAYPALFDACRRARHHIHLQTYIIAPDAIGRELLDLLAARAAAGVRVRMLYDQFGSAQARLSGFFRPYRHRPNLHLVGFTQVNPIKRQFQINLRNHRKIAVIDGRTGFIGGMNISAAHLPTGRAAPVRDYHFEAHGPVVHELQYTFLRDWYYMTDENPDTLLCQEHFPQLDCREGMAMRIVNGGPTSEVEVLCDAFFNIFAAAERQILLATPYFVPPDDLRRALRAAALRGVDVRVLVPATGNHLSVAYAAASHYEFILKAGVRLFMRRPPFMHSKLLLVDDRIAVVGTANFDNRSLKLNYETTVQVFDTRFAEDLKRCLLDDFAAADEVTLESWQRRPAGQRLIENFFNLMGPSL